MVGLIFDLKIELLDLTCMALAVWPICMLDKSANLAITLIVCLWHLSIYVFAQAAVNGLSPTGGEQ